MARLEDLTPGARVEGIHPGSSVAVVAVDWHGGEALTLTYRTDDGTDASCILYRDDEPRLKVVQAGMAWSFSMDGDRFKLAAEALRMRFAHLFDPYAAVNSSAIEPLPHQITAVYHHMLPRHPLRFLLADDPGAGKTIMSGLFIRELMIRGDLERCLIIAPGSLTEQWQDELYTKFSLQFRLISRPDYEAALDGNPFTDAPLAIARLDQLARNETAAAKAASIDWDLIIVDEAHKASAHWFGSEMKRTKRYELIQMIGEHARHLLLLTATPHSGDQASFELFMSLLDADRFEGRPREGTPLSDHRDMMRRLVKDKLVRFDKTPLFPERIANTVRFELSPGEARLYETVTAYVREQMGRAEAVASDKRRGNIVGFALTTLQRRLASSPEAIYRSIQRRLKKLDNALAEARLGRIASQEVARDQRAFSDEEFDEDEFMDDLDADELERVEDEVVEGASAATTIAELEAEIDELALCERLADEVRRSDRDTKWEQLRALLEDDPLLKYPNGDRRKLIIFTEHRDTLDYLRTKITNLVGRDEAVVVIHGGLPRDSRKEAQERFISQDDAAILIATDAAGEGVNLQVAHLLVNYDLPWNPNRIEQRFGRIHRIGQKEVCHMWNLVAANTREGDVFERLFAKLEIIRQQLGDEVFDVLGETFEGRSLRDLLLQAIRYGDDPEVRARLFEVVDDAMEIELAKKVQDRQLTSDRQDHSDVDTIRMEMERAQARRLQPHFIHAFFEAAFRDLGGRAAPKERGRIEVAHVPVELRQRHRIVSGVPLISKYDRITFDKAFVNVDGHRPATFVGIGHPLLEATISQTLERHRAHMKMGATLIDDRDPSDQPRVLVLLEHLIRDGRQAGNHASSRKILAVELGAEGSMRDPGYAPYLDYRTPTDIESQAIEPLLGEDWLRGDFEREAIGFAIREVVPAHLTEVRDRTLARVAAVRAAVHARLTEQIRYWDHRAFELKLQEEAGKQPKMNADRARARCDELEGRLARRLEELEREAQLTPSPPNVLGAALIVPLGWLVARGIGSDTAMDGGDPLVRAATERRAVEAVMATEVRLRRKPTEMPVNNPGYDIESLDPETGDIWFIEVKGRIPDGTFVQITKRELLTSANQPDRFILALVEVAETGDTVRYRHGPIPGAERADFFAGSVPYDLAKLLAEAITP